MNRRFIPALLGSAALLWIVLVGATPQDPPQITRIDPMLQITLERLEVQARSIHGIGELSQLARSAGVMQAPVQPDNPIFNLIVRGDNAERAVEEVGGRVGTRLGPVVTAWVPMSGVRELAVSPGVEYVEASTLLYPHLDTSVPATRADLVHGGSYNLRGQGTLVAIFDTGLDYTHKDFRNADGTTRVKYMWDQTATGGTWPTGYNYGAEWSKADIDAELGSTPPGVVTEADIEGHGTHVAGIAAGNGRATGGSVPAETYVGIAPEADLLIVKGGNESFPVSNIIDGISWTMAKADGLGQPVVINLSLGGHYGAHDGTSSHEVAIDAAVGPGKVVVVSAGNEADDGIHDKVSLTSSAPIDTMIISIAVYDTILGSSNDWVRSDIWYDGGAAVSLTVNGPSGTVYGPWTIGSNSGQGEPDGSVWVNNAGGGSNPINGDNEMVVDIYDADSTIPPAEGSWKLIYKLESGTAATVDLWIYSSSTSIDDVVIENAQPACTVGMPGTAREAITVGSYTTKNSWTDIDGVPRSISAQIGDISYFSSRGPTRRDERLKPEITGPGEWIGSALSGDATEPNYLKLQDGVHVMLQGTSMSAPHVAGAVALLLQAQPYLTASQIKDYLTATAVKDSYTGPTENNTWGWGKLDVKAAVDLALATGDTLAPTFTVGIMRNSVLSDYLDLYFVPSEILAETPTATVDTTALTLSTVTSSEATLYVGDYTIPASGTYTISVSGSDLAGNDTTITRQFAAQMITVSEGGLLLAAGGALQATFTPYSLVRDEYIIARRLEEEDKYELLPHDRTLSRKARLVISYDPADLIGIDPSSLGMYRWDNGEWRYVESYVDVARRQVEASIGKLGIYKLLSSDNNPAAPLFSYGLDQNYPNPFNVSTQIRYTLARQTRVELFILNTRGQRVRTLVDRVEAAGSHVAGWDGRNDAGRSVASGIYLVMLRANGRVFTRKALLLK